MGFRTKVQLINRRKSQQFYINFPSACAQMMGLRKGEVVEWVLTGHGELLLRRPEQEQGVTRDGEATSEKQAPRSG